MDRYNREQKIIIESPKRSVDEIMQENLELMYNIRKNRNNFCSLVGGC